MEELAKQRAEEFAQKHFGDRKTPRKEQAIQDYIEAYKQALEDMKTKQS